MVADRTVTVRLELDVASYLAHLREAESATKRFGDGAKTANDKADTSTKTLTRDVKDTGTAMGDAEKTVKTLGTSTRKAGEDASASAKNWQGLKTEIKDTREHMLGLLQTFARTGDRSLLTRITGDRSELQRLESMNKELERLESTNNRFHIPVVGAGLSRSFLAASDAALQSIQDVLQKTPPVLSVPLVITAVSFAATAIAAIGAAVSFAVLAAVGGGVLAGGIALAWKDPQVAAAAHRFAVEAGADLKDAASQGLGSAVSSSLRSLSRDISGLAPVVKETFSTLAPGLEDLIHGVGGMLTRLFSSSGWQLAMGEAARILTQIGNELPFLGDALATFFGSMARSGPGAEAFLRMFFSWLEASVEFTGFLVEGLSKVFKVMSDLFGLMTTSGNFGALGLLGTVLGGLGITGEKSFHQIRDAAQATEPAIVAATTAQETLNATLATAAGRSSNYRQAMDLLFKAQQDVIGGNIDYHDKVVALDEALKANGDTVDINTRKGVDNLNAIKNVAEAIIKERDNHIANGTTIVDANKIRDDEIRKLIDDARHHGILTGEVRNLINTYGEIPVSKNTNVTITGAAKVYEDLINLKSAQLALSQNIDVSQANKEVRNQIGRGIGGLAAGGPVFGPGTSTSDSIPARLSAGEHVWTAAEVQAAGGHAAVEWLRQFMLHGRSPQAKYPGDESGGIAFAFGGPVLNWPKGPIPMPVDVSHTKMPYTMQQLQDKFGGGPAMTFLKAQVGKPYIWASAGPGGYDCSGIVSAIWNILHHSSPYNHTFSTFNEAPYFPFAGVGGVLSAGWTNPGEPGPGGNSVGHTAGLLAGVPFESTGGVGVRMGAGVTNIHSFAHVGHFDRGGYLQPGVTLAYNGTGAPERVMPGDGPMQIVGRMTLDAGGQRTLTGMVRGEIQAADKAAARDADVRARSR